MPFTFQGETREGKDDLNRNICSSAKKIKRRTPSTATQILSKNLRKLE